VFDRGHVFATTITSLICGLLHDERFRYLNMGTWGFRRTLAAGALSSDREERPPRRGRLFGTASRPYLFSTT